MIAAMAMAAEIATRKKRHGRGGAGGAGVAPIMRPTIRVGLFLLEVWIFVNLATEPKERGKRQRIRRKVQTPIPFPASDGGDGVPAVFR
jgi:hypothetical protein